MPLGFSAPAQKVRRPKGKSQRVWRLVSTAGCPSNRGKVSLKLSRSLSAALKR
ncbi:hypothetical protein A2U01_0090026, partial [Trifolium medium]|nr:hypothetical protein [Trifolium medium]